MDYFSKINDLGLRRLYKFILKKTIGIYLESELLIEQLEVSSRTGLVTLHDINLNCDTLNEDYFSSLPFKLCSFRISKLEVVISYVSLLYDGCRFQANDIEIILEPNNTISKNVSSTNNTNIDDKTKVFTSSLGDKIKSINQSAVQDSVSPLSNDGIEGMNFIANWIEIVLARLEVTVENLNIIIRKPDQLVSKPKKSSLNNNNKQVDNKEDTYPIGIKFHLSKASFFNTIPNNNRGGTNSNDKSSMFGNNMDSTVASSMRLSQAGSSVLRLDSAKKVSMKHNLF